MSATLAVLVLSSVVLGQSGLIHMIPTIPVELSGPAGAVTFVGTLYCSALHPSLGGTLTVDGDPIPVPTQAVQSSGGFVWWRWKIGGHVLRIDVSPTGSLDGAWITLGRAGSAIRLR